MRHILWIFLFVSSICHASENLELLISPNEIAQKIQDVAVELDQEYADKDLVIIMILKGSLCVTADLIRALHVPFTLDWIKANSYGVNGSVGKNLQITGFEKLNLESKHVLLVDDIFDTGNTMVNVVEKLKEKNPKSLKSLVLVLKRNPNQITHYRPDYTLFEINNRFVVGYGLDYKEKYRGLPGVYAFINDLPPQKE